MGLIFRNYLLLEIITQFPQIVRRYFVKKKSTELIFDFTNYFQVGGGERGTLQYENS